MERRVSPRTKTDLSVTVGHKKPTHTRCVELSQTGMLIEGGRVRKKSARMTLEFPDGPAEVLARPVGKRRGGLAVAIVPVAETDQAKLTDFLFECMLVAS